MFSNQKGMGFILINESKGKNKFLLFFVEKIKFKNLSSTYLNR